VLHDCVPLVPLTAKPRNGRSKFLGGRTCGKVVSIFARVSEADLRVKIVATAPSGSVASVARSQIRPVAGRARRAGWDEIIEAFTAICRIPPLALEVPEGFEARACGPTLG